MDSLDLLQQSNYSDSHQNPFQPSYQEHEHEREQQEQEQQQRTQNDLSTFYKSQDESITNSPVLDKTTESNNLSLFCSQLQSNSNSNNEDSFSENQRSLNTNPSTNTIEASSILLNHQTSSSQQTIDNLQDFVDQDVNKEQSENAEKLDSCEAIDDDYEFIALCTDASFVLNNDPTRRYFINKLYQPLNSNQEDSASLIEQQDDEYLLYQELRFLETTAQELTEERQRVQTTKILEDDDGDEDEDDDDIVKDSEANHQVREDPLDSLQLTTIIESLESSDSPEAAPTTDSAESFTNIISGDVERDDNNLPLIASCQQHTDTHKHPDSSFRFDNHTSTQADSSSLSITCTPVDAHLRHNQVQSHYSDQQQELLSGDNQLLSSPRLSSTLDKHNDDEDSNSLHQFDSAAREANFLLSSSSDFENHSVINESQRVYHNQHHQYSNPHDINNQLLAANDEKQQSSFPQPDNSSEINCFHQVSSTFMSPASSCCSNSKHELTSPSSCSILTPSPLEQPHNNSNPTTTTQSPSSRNKDTIIGANDSSKSSSISRAADKQQERPRKRCLQQMIDQTTTKDTLPEEACSQSPKKKTDIRQVRRREKRICVADGKESAGATSSLTNSVTSTIIQLDPAIEQRLFNGSSNSSGSISRAGSSCITELDNDDLMSLEGDDNNSTSSSSHQQSQHPHMSKYRRRTANARERIRMREINQAFEKLKKVVPIEMIHTVSGDELSDTSSRRGSSKSTNDSQSVKLTKITTLRLAVSYIARLSEVLNEFEDGAAGSRINSSSSNVATTEGSITRGAGCRTKSSKSVLPGKSETRKKRNRQANSAKASSNKLIKQTGEGHKFRVSSDTLKQHQHQKQSPVSSIREDQINKSQQITARRPIIVTNNILNGTLHQNNTTFLPIQHSQQLNQQQHQQQHLAYCSAQQPLTISQASDRNSNTNNRTFVTPVAVAILGIQTTPNNQTTNSMEPQALHLLGIQSSTLHQRQQHQPIQHSVNQIHQVATNNQFSLINSQHPQQVTFTLDDINGLSVLRLANTSTHQQTPHTTTALQLHQDPQIIHSINTNNSNFNLTQTAYQQQPLQSAATMTSATTLRPMAQQQATLVRFRNHTTNSPAGNIINAINSSGNQIITTTGNNNDSSTNNHLNNSSQQHSNNNGNSTVVVRTSTGTHGDCNSFSISQNGLMAQHLVSNSNINSQALRIQQSNGTVLAVTTGAQLSQSAQSSIQTMSNIQQVASTGNCQQQTANIIYLNPGNLSTTTRTNCNIVNLGNSQQMNVPPMMTGSRAQNISKNESLNSNSLALEQMKFVTQFSSSNGNQQRSSGSPNVSEASIRQLVASLTTSIHPSTDSRGKTTSDNANEQTSSDQLTQRQQQQNHQQQPAKRTYRFHNYDGSMITNQLYGSNHHDKQSAGQVDSNSSSSKRIAHQQQSDQSSTNLLSSSNGGQRSRQNSLSSTCSTTSSSSSSSSLISSLSTPTPTPARLVKSPSINQNTLNHHNEQSRSSTSSSLLTTTTMTTTTSRSCLVNEESADSVIVTGCLVGVDSNSD